MKHNDEDDDFPNGIAKDGTIMHVPLHLSDAAPAIGKHNDIIDAMLDADRKAWNASMALMNRK